MSHNYVVAGDFKNNKQSDIISLVVPKDAVPNSVGAMVYITGMHPFSLLLLIN